MPRPKPRNVAGTVDDPTISFAALDLEGKTYKLAYSFNALAAAEAAAKCNLLAGLENLRDLSAVQLRGLLYAALSVAHPRMTVEDAGLMIHPFTTPARPETITPITRALAEAYGLSMPEDKKPDPPAGDDPPDDENH
jgi:hypothetical protein